LKCIKLIDEAKKTGANLVKLQVVDPHENYEKETSSFKIFNKSTLSDEEIFNIYNYCKKKKINLFSTFDKKKFDFFKKVNQPCYKISSSLFYDYYLIKDILKTKKPIIISTGVADLNDVDIMINLIKKDKNKKVALLHCRSLYPTKNSKLHLSRIKYFSEKYKIISGYSDHTLGIDAPVAAINLGAKIIEKHFTLNSRRNGYDHNISLEPKQFSLMIKKIRENEDMIGKPDFKIFNNDKDFKKIKTIIRGYKTTKDIKKNSYLKKNDFSPIRLLNNNKITKFSKIIKSLLNKKISKNIKKGKVLSLNDFK
jgi:sialic acid synthase SpsE